LLLRLKILTIGFLHAAIINLKWNCCNEKGTVHESWSPLACGRNGFFRNPILAEIGAKYDKTAAQVGLRFLYQQDIIIIPKSTHIEHMRENLDLLDFELAEEEMNALYALDLGKSLFGWW
ncbi:MAG: aldo/keto reductase, partial [Oscillospiraceae bacterium]|nr:aldo/keto reductase [Oscillospiraceae bacterium]